MLLLKHNEFDWWVASSNILVKNYKVKAKIFVPYLFWLGENRVSFLISSLAWCHLPQMLQQDTLSSLIWGCSSKKLGQVSCLLCLAFWSKPKSKFLEIQLIRTLLTLLENFVTFWNFLEHIGTYPNLLEPIRTYSYLTIPIPTYPNLYQPNRTYSNLSEPIWTYSNLSEYIRTYLNLFEYIRTYSILSEPILNFWNLSEPFRTI